MANKLWYALRVQSEREEKIKEGSWPASVRRALRSSSADRGSAENVSEIREGKKKVSHRRCFPATFSLS